MEMGVDGMGSKCGCNLARLRLKELKPNLSQGKRFILGSEITPKKK